MIFLSIFGPLVVKHRAFSNFGDKMVKNHVFKGFASWQFFVSVGLSVAVELGSGSGTEN